MDDATLLRMAVAAFGRAALRDLLGVNDRAVSHWLAGSRPVPSGIWRDLHAAAAVRHQALGELLAALSERVQ